MLLLNPTPPTRAQDFRDKGTYVIPDGRPYVAQSYPDSTQTVVDGIVTNSFTRQYGTSSASSQSVPAPSFQRSLCVKPKKRRRASAAQQAAVQTVATPQSLAQQNSPPPSPINALPWWLIGMAAFIFFVGLPQGGSEI